MKVAAALMASHGDRNASVTQNVSRAIDLGKVDAVVLINGGTHRFTVEDWPLVHTVHSSFVDNWPAQRNKYLTGVDALQADWQDDVLICVFDDDEHFSDVLWRNIRQIGEQALEDDVNNLAVRCHSVTLNLRGQEIRRTVDEYWKALLLLWEPGIQYVAVTHDGSPAKDSFVHEWLVIPSGTRYRRLDDPLHYVHLKTIGDVWFRAARNVWAGGGGKNLGTLNPLWQPFKALVRRHAPWVQTSMDFENYLKAGNIHEEVKQGILSFRHLGTDHDARNSLWVTWPDATSEYREIALTYFVLLHPEELPQTVIDGDRDKLNWYEYIEQVHGVPAPG